MNHAVSGAAEGDNKMPLESMSLEQAATDWMNGKKNSLTQSSIANNKHRLSVFIDWCRDERGITQTDEVTGKVVHDFKVWRSEKVSPVTARKQLGTIRQFLRWGERVDLVPKGVGELMELPETTDKDEVNEKAIPEGEAKEVLEYLNTFQYGTFDHALCVLLWRTGVRISTAHAWDVDDFHPDKEYIEVVHRPERGTGLKKKEKGERYIKLKSETCRVVQDWIDMNHPKVTDRFGRMPLFGTRYGRAHTTTIRDHIYRVTRPCVFAGQCPKGYEKSDCDYALSEKASGCPVNYNPHAFRKGSITAQRNAGAKRDAVSGRADVSEKILEKHYDMGSKEDKMKRRQDRLGGF